MQDFTHELVLEREQKENKHKIIIKTWPQRAPKCRIFRPSQSRRLVAIESTGFTLTPVTNLILTDTEAHQRFERFACTSFSTKWPLQYWDAQGNKAQHWKGGWHKLVITNYLGKTDLVINMRLTTAMQILTTHQDSGYAGTMQLSHRTTDKQINDLEARKVITKATYDKDRGVVAIIAEKHLVEIHREHWHDAWKTAHKEHPRYPTYGKYLYAVTFAAARLDDNTGKTRCRRDYNPPSAQSIAATKSRAKRQGNSNPRNNSTEATAEGELLPSSEISRIDVPDGTCLREGAPEQCPSG